MCSLPFNHLSIKPVASRASIIPAFEETFNSGLLAVDFRSQPDIVILTSCDTSRLQLFDPLSVSVKKFTVSYYRTEKTLQVVSTP